MIDQYVYSTIFFTLNLQKRKAREVAQAQREAALAAGLRTPPQKKKHRARNALPKLNFGGLVKAPPPSKAYMEDVHESWTSL
ncbi:unnamed protein product [Cylicostephanus goldi]|uniref:Uncharacterized protein n=1 Tax=Cylicostephanus goldi TaxID=71465 RepID=A0A3P7PW66_CYLGO|nr:unnamed protein product [Cylicostephanus goldi]